MMYGFSQANISKHRCFENELCLRHMNYGLRPYELCLRHVIFTFILMKRGKKKAWRILKSM